MVPPLFRALTVEQAIAAGKAEGKLVLIDFTAEWCAPCKTMDKTTWVAEPVVHWVNENAVAVQIDVDQAKAQAQPFGVQAMPTMVLLKDGAELDRTTGARPAAKLLEWLANAKAGRTELDTTLESLRDDDPDGWLHVGRMLARRGRIDEAMKQFERCWFDSLKVRPEWYGVRLSFLAEALRQVTEASPEARAKVTEWRDGAEGRLPDRQAFHDWLTLNGVLGQNTRVLEWFDREKHRLPSELRRHSALVRFLRRAERWEDYGRLIEAPVAEFVELTANYRGQQVPPGTPEEQVKEMHAFLAHALREQARAMKKALLAAGRTDEALQLEAKAVELDPTDEMRDALATA